MPDPLSVTENRTSVPRGSAATVTITSAVGELDGVVDETRESLHDAFAITKDLQGLLFWRQCPAEVEQLGNRARLKCLEHLVDQALDIVLSAFSDRSPLPMPLASTKSQISRFIRSAARRMHSADFVLVSSDAAGALCNICACNWSVLSGF